MNKVGRGAPEGHLARHLRGNVTNAGTLVDLGGNALRPGVSSPGSAPQPMPYDRM